MDRCGDAVAARLRGRLAADALFYGATALAEHGIAWHGVALWLAARGRRQKAAALSIGLVCEALVVDGLLKAIVGRSRPLFPGMHRFPLRRPRSASFPSGHAAAAAFSTVMLANRSNAAALVAAATVVSWSRVHVGVHHLSDVAGGAVVGVALGALARRAGARWLSDPPPAESARPPFRLDGHGSP